MILHRKKKMNRLKVMVLVGVGCFVGLLMIIRLVETNISGLVQKSDLAFKGTKTDLALKWTKAKHDRDILSQRLNSVLHKYGRLMCTINNNTSETGGWCDSPFTAGHIMDRPLAITMANVFRNTTLASFGDGPGSYKAAVLATGLVKTYDAYDGSPNIEKATKREVKFLDLTIPHFGFSVYDWVISLEVAEHIPVQYEQVYLSNMFRHAKRGIVVSWAVPKQGGFQHVNERVREYVVESFKSNCFEVDETKTEVLVQNATTWWLKQNILVFSRRISCPLDMDET